MQYIEPSSDPHKATFPAIAGEHLTMLPVLYDHLILKESVS
jgi:hypothetical protein